MKQHLVQNIFSVILTTIFMVKATIIENHISGHQGTEQYHIQTDLGSERFFRYQTKSGQFRKENRNPDGSVTGSYGWIDPNGTLRIYEYVADNHGYRIVKTKLKKINTPNTSVEELPDFSKFNYETSNFYDPSVKSAENYHLDQSHHPEYIHVTHSNSYNPAHKAAQSYHKKHEVHSKTRLKNDGFKVFSLDYMSDPEFEYQNHHQYTTDVLESAYHESNPITKQAQATMYFAPTKKQKFVIGHEGGRQPLTQILSNSKNNNGFVIGLSYNPPLSKSSELIKEEEQAAVLNDSYLGIPQETTMIARQVVPMDKSNRRGGFYVIGHT